jgi:hypothetical protein
MDDFSEAMTQNKSSSGDNQQHVEYQPSDKELNQTLDKAKKMNDKIWQETHPAEFKKQQDAEAQKKKDEETYAAEA